MKKADLHTHSYYSDGQISPKELVRLAKKRGLKYLALTDHDSVKGVKEAVAEGKRIGVIVIPAVEIRCRAGEILSYFIDINNKKLLKVLKENSRKIQSRIRDRCKKLARAGYKISYKELEKRFPKAKGNLNEFHPLYYLYLKGYGSTLELGRKFWQNPKLKHKKIKVRPAVEIIKLVKKAGGVPVLPHPWVEEAELLNKISSLVKAGLKGLEINNGDSLSWMRKMSGMKDIVPRMRKAAKRYNLILTRGTDFHGKKTVKLMPGKHDIGKVYCSESVVKKLERLR